MRTFIATLIGVLLLNPVWALPEFRGPLPEEQQAIIHFLAGHHVELKRAVTITESGYTATTTSDNVEIVEKLKAHFSYMEKRLGSGAMVRRWDPAFAEMVQYYDQLDSEVMLLDDGIKIDVTGKNAVAVQVAQNHARIVTGFVSEGKDAVQRSHPAVLPESTD